MPEIDYDSRFGEKKLPVPPQEFYWLAFVVIAFHIRLFGILPYIDFADESVYLGRRGWSASTLQWAAPYSAWYSGWWLVTGDRYLSFILNGIFVSAAIVFLAFFILLKLGASRVWALLAGVSLLFWEPLMGSPVKVTHFLVFLLLCTVLWALYSFKRNADRFLFLGACSVWLCFVRQEALIFAVGAGLLSLLSIAWERWILKKPVVRPDGTTLIIGIGGLGAIALLSPFGSRRAWLAFRDHFCWSHGRGADDLFVQSFFPSSQTIFGAMQENPGAFFTFGINNLIRLFSDISENFFSTLPGWSWHWYLVGCCLLVALIHSPRNYWRGLRARLKGEDLIFFSGLASIAVGQALVTTFLFRHDVKYSIAAFIMMLIVLFYLLDPLKDLRISKMALPFGCILILAMLWVNEVKTPNSPYRWYYQSDVREENQLITRWRKSWRLSQKRILHFRDYSLYFKVNVLAQMNPPPYFVYGLHSVESYLDEQNIDFIIFPKKDFPLCSAGWGDGACKQLEAAIDKCYAEIDSEGSIKLYEKSRTCTQTRKR